MSKEEIGAVLKELRNSSGMTQKEVAELIGRKQQIVGHWETGYSQPDANMLFTLCEIYGTTVDEAFGFKRKEEHISSNDIKLLKKYHNLDDHGKEMVDFTLEKEYERSIKNADQLKENKIYSFTPKTSFVAEEPAEYHVDAAHTRTDIDIPEDVDTSEDDIMDEDNF